MAKGIGGNFKTKNLLSLIFTRCNHLVFVLCSGINDNGPYLGVVLYHKGSITHGAKQLPLLFGFILNGEVGLKQIHLLKGLGVKHMDESIRCTHVHIPIKVSEDVYSMIKLTQHLTLLRETIPCIQSTTHTSYQYFIGIMAPGQCPDGDANGSFGDRQGQGKIPLCGECIDISPEVPHSQHWPIGVQA